MHKDDHHGKVHSCKIFNKPVLSCIQGTVLHVKVEDNDTNKRNDLVDLFVIPINSSVAIDQQIGPTVYTGVHGFAHIGLTLSVLCSDGFYGPFCNVSCPTGSSCRTCLPGFTGRYCQTEIDDCVGIDCGNGQCMDHVGFFLCTCDPGYIGSNCNLRDHCHSNPCQDGQCNNTSDGFVCMCDPGYIGDRCEEVDHCYNSTCTLCVNVPGGYLCQCEPGYTGESCDVNIDDCSGVTCPENQICVDGINTFMCVCAAEESLDENCITQSPQTTPQQGKNA